jgi:hypothetical protein
MSGVRAVARAADVDAATLARIASGEMLATTAVAERADGTH